VGACGVATPQTMTSAFVRRSSGNAAGTEHRVPVAVRLGWASDAPPITFPVSVAGAALFVTALVFFSTRDTDLADVAGMLALLGASALAEAFPVPIEGVAAGRTSLANIFIVGAAVIYGWSAASIVGFVAMATVELAHRRRLDRLLFNTGLYTLAAGAAGGGAAIVTGNGLWWLLVATALASSAFYLVDITLLSGVISEATGKPFFAVYGRSMFSTAAPFAIMTSLAAILVVLWDQSPFLAVALTGPLVAIALYERRVHAVLQRLRELDSLKNEFIAVVSHELRTPIASVYGASTTLQRRTLDEHRRDSLLSIIYAESARLARLVDQVVWASRFESGHVTVNLERCDPASLAAQVIDAARIHLPDTLRIDFEADRSLPTILADPERVRQVLVNLLDNAVKFSPEGGRIGVALEQVDGHVRFAVADEGLGIPAHEQMRIFEKFHRLDADMTRGVGGTGLGLYICQELVRQMDGRIWVDSQERQGSTFVFELPAA
jgi:signal transduction histidine kinase